MNWIIGAIGVFVLFVQLWLHYLAIMNLDRNKARLTTPAKTVAYPIVVIGYILDIAFNLTIGSIMFAEVPHAWLFTDRVQRHLRAETWRGAQARWWCKHFLDPFDPDGKHC